MFISILRLILLFSVWAGVILFVVYIKIAQSDYEKAKARKRRMKKAKKIQKKAVTLLVNLDTGEIIEKGKLADVSFS